MRSSILFAVLAGAAWGIGGYFEKAGLRMLGLQPIAGITLRTLVALVVLGLISIPAWRAVDRSAGPAGWLMLVLGGGVLAGSLGMWSFYTALASSPNLGVTLAIAFACSPVAGTLLGLARGDQPFNGRIVLGLLAIVGGTVLVQLGRAPTPR